MTDNISIITKWNKLFDWRQADIRSTDILKDITYPGTFILSAKSYGLKGFLPGARHSWVSTFNGVSWKTYEITDIETIQVQGAKIFFADYTTKDRLQLIVSDRDPSCFWFGNEPLIDYQGAYINLDDLNYPLNSTANLITNNCNTFVSYIVFYYNLNFNKTLIGFKTSKFWRELTTENLNTSSYFDRLNT